MVFIKNVITQLKENTLNFFTFNVKIRTEINKLWSLKENPSPY
jgi:hypothetical protein